MKTDYTNNRQREMVGGLGNTPIKTAEEVLNSKWLLNKFDKDSILLAMEEYASQFKPTSSSTEEEKLLRIYGTIERDINGVPYDEDNLPPPTPSPSTVDFEREAEELAEQKFPYPEWYGTQSQNNQSAADIIIEIDKSRYDFTSGYIAARKTTSQEGLREFKKLVEFCKKIQPDFDKAESYQHGFHDAIEVLLTKANEILNK